VEVVYFFEPCPTEATWPMPPQLSTADVVELQLSPSWPKEATKGQAYLYYKGEEVDHLAIRRWLGSSSWRAATDAYFDPNHDFLVSVLAEKSNSSAFEHAVVRLFSIAGIPTVWYGEARLKGRPDFASFFSATNGEKVVVLGDCTLEKPASKFTPIKERATELQEVLGDAAIVLPVVVTASNPAQSDLKHAQHDGIVLIGREELRKLLGMIRQDATPQEVIDYFASLRAQMLSALASFPPLSSWRT